MEDKKVHLLFIIKNSEVENAKPWEAGAKSRLATLQTGIVQGLITAGYRKEVSHRKGAIKLHSEKDIVTVLLVSHDEWVQD